MKRLKGGWRDIRIQEDTADELQKLIGDYESFDTIIRKCLIAYYKETGLKIDT